MTDDGVIGILIAHIGAFGYQRVYKLLSKQGSNLKFVNGRFYSKMKQGRAPILYATPHLDLIYIPTKYNQKILKGYKSF